MPAKFEADPEGVINLAFSIKINQKKMKKLEREYTTMKTKEKEDEIELRVSSHKRTWHTVVQNLQKILLISPNTLGCPKQTKS